MTIDVAAALRRRKPERRSARLRPRRSDKLRSVYDLPEDARIALVPDTNVYVLEAAGRLPPEASRLIDQGLSFHCSVCLAELTTGIANADPFRADWADMRDHYVDLFRATPATRVVTPDESVWIDAGMIAGTLARLQGFQRHQRKECLNDALLYLVAAGTGVPVLTQDRGDFDLIQQIASEGEFIYF